MSQLPINKLELVYDINELIYEFAREEEEPVMMRHNEFIVIESMYKIPYSQLEDLIKALYKHGFDVPPFVFKQLERSFW